jgi:predicted RNA-binding protein YlxR (DUF448 family)
LALDEGDRVIWDERGTAPGRGAYICPSSECLAEALKKNRLSRAFRKTVSKELLGVKAPWEK